MAYGYYPFLGGLLFWLGLVLAIILFANYKKFYPVFYMISIAFYIFTVGFAIDIYEIARVGILSILVVSAVIFMILGKYFSKIIHHKK